MWWGVPSDSATLSEGSSHNSPKRGGSLSAGLIHPRRRKSGACDAGATIQQVSPIKDDRYFDKGEVLEEYHIDDSALSAIDSYYDGAMSPGYHTMQKGTALKTVSIIQTLSEMTQGPPPTPSCSHPEGKTRNKKSLSQTSQTLPRKLSGGALPLLSPSSDVLFDSKSQGSLLNTESILFPKQFKKKNQASFDKNRWKKTISPANNKWEDNLYSTRGLKERGKTPDWIKGIFDSARRGNLEKLKLSLSCLEPSLVRNLTDKHGNNLLHILSAGGHIGTLQWLCKIPSLHHALEDENRAGATPLVMAVKHGRLECVEWLLVDAEVSDKLVHRNGERTVFHYAAKYGQEKILRWLGEWASSRGEERAVNARDQNGDMPLHLAAKYGRLASVQVLLELGADVSLRNDAGLKPCDQARFGGNLACLDHLLLYESGVELSQSLAECRDERNTLLEENLQLRDFCREVSTIGKKFVSQRTSMVNSLLHLHTLMVDLHDKMLREIQLLFQENSQLRQKRNGSKKLEQGSEEIQATIEMCQQLHNQWQLRMEEWRGCSRSDLDRRLQLAEEGWKRIKGIQRTWDVVREPQQTFRRKLQQARERTTRGSGLNLLNFTSSESSIQGSSYSSEAEDPTSAQFPPNSAYDTGVQFLSTPTYETSVPKSKVSYDWCSPIKSISDADVNLDSYLTRVLRESECLRLSPRQRLDIDAILNDPEFITSSPIRKQSPCKSSKNVIASRARHRKSVPPSVKLPTQVIQSEDFSKSVLSLSTDVGCSVLEVIEPLGSDSDDKTLPGSISQEQECPQSAPDNPKPSQRKKLDPHKSPREKSLSNSIDDELERVKLTKRHLPSDDSGKLKSPETSGDLETAESASESERPKCDIPEVIRDVKYEEEVSECLNEDPTEQVLLAADSEPSGADNVIVGKKKGFLQKISLKARWPSKRRLKVSKKMNEITPDEFRDTYMGRNEGVLVEHEGAKHEYGLCPGKDSGDSAEDNQPQAAWDCEALCGPKSMIQSASTNGSDCPEDQSLDASESCKAKGLETDALDCCDQSSPSPTVNSSESSEKNQKNLRMPRLLRLSHLAKSSPDIKSQIEALSISASEDSGIVARPSSSASKSDSLSRPDSTMSSFKGGYPLRKASSISTDLLPTPDSSTAGRLSPAPSEVSKTESALSPPSHASDVSKTESTRQLHQLGKIQEAGESDRNITIIPLYNQCVKVANIVDINESKCDTLPINPDKSSKSSYKKEAKKGPKEQKPWYELSDDESDMLTPERLTKLIPVRSSSEDENES